MLLRLSTGERPLGSWRAWWGKEEEESGVPLLRSRLGETGSDLMLMLGLVLTVKVAVEMEAVAACGRRLPCLAERGEGGEGQKPGRARWRGRQGRAPRWLPSHLLETEFLAKMSNGGHVTGKRQPATNRGQLLSAQNAAMCVRVGGEGWPLEVQNWGVYYNFQQSLSDWP